MERDAHLASEVTTTPEGEVLVEMNVPRWTWPRRRTVRLQLVLSRNEAAVMQARLARILDGGAASDRFNDGQGLPPHYRGAVQ